jgi:hypothetical protein
MERLDPTWTKSNTEKVDPNRVRPYTLNELPNRRYCFKEQADPNVIKSRRENEDPRRAKPYTDAEEPHRI